MILDLDVNINTNCQQGAIRRIQSEMARDETTIKTINLQTCALAKPVSKPVVEP